MKTTRIASAIASILACSLLAGCGGGGGGGMVRSPAPVSTPPAPPPPLPSTPASNTVSCPSNSNCTLDIPNTNKFLAPVLSTHALDKQGPGGLLLSKDTFGFASGTEIRSGFLSVHEATLRSNIHVAVGATVMASGSSSRIEGSVVNDGKTLLGGGPAIAGNLDNRGLLSVEGAFRILGDFRQSGSGTYSIALPPAGTSGALEYARLDVLGMAHLAGTLQLNEILYDRAWGEEPLPATGVGYHLLHADGGVFGAFDRWTSPRLFIEGGLRYGSNDVWFDLSRVSVQAAMSGQGFGGITLASASNLDRALTIADGFSPAPRASQSRFLRSASRLLWLNDAAQAARSLDSLAGSQHVAAIQALAQDDVLTRGIGARTLALRPGDHAGAWSRLQGSDTIAGFDQWRSPRLLAGATATQARDARSDRLGGQAQSESPQAALYLRWFGDGGWYAGGSAGYAQHALALDRRIDLADGRHWSARAERRLGIASLDVEAGRRLDLASATVSPYAWLGADTVRSERAVEQGQTGLELALQGNTQASLDAGLGLRLGKRWRIGETGWLALDADARYRQRLMQSGASLRGAFIGVPDAWFDVPGNDARGGTWLDLGLRGGFGRGWGWSLGHGGSLTGHATDQHWKLGLQRKL